VQEGRDVRCGFVSVPLDYADPRGRTIRIAVAVIEADNPTPAPDPVMILGGGPGDELIDLLLGELVAPDPENPFGPLAQNRDLVLLDQRGAGFSRPALECDTVGATFRETVGMSSASANRRLLARYASCVRRLRRAGAELGAYKTPNNARDLDEVRQALGYERVNVFGTSYGTYLALDAARRSPGWIRSLTLSSPAPTQRNLVEEAPAAYRSSVRAVTRACAAEPACAALTPDFEAALNRVVRRLGENPRRLSVPVPGRSPVTVVLDGPRVSGLMFTLLYTAQVIPVLPPLIAAADAGNYGPLGELFAAVRTADVPDVQSEVMQAAFWCSEEIATTSQARLRRAASRGGYAQGRALQNAPLLGLLFGPQAFSLCDELDVGRSEPSLFRPVRTSIPTFIATGRFDPITPPRFGAVLLPNLSNSFRIDFAAAGHSPLLSSRCGIDLLTQFVSNPLEAPPGQACAAAPLSLAPPTEASASRRLRQAVSEAPGLARSIE
jgi:pimeloyl-ACP methyl ester carboxylesterase